MYFMMSYERHKTHPERMEWNKNKVNAVSIRNVKAVTKNKFKFELKDNVTVDVSKHTEKK